VRKGEGWEKMDESEKSDNGRPKFVHASINLSESAEEILKIRRNEHYSTGSVSDLLLDQQAF
jgi:hypothetical protein